MQYPRLFVVAGNPKNLGIEYFSELQSQGVLSLEYFSTPEKVLETFRDSPDGLYTPKCLILDCADFFEQSMGLLTFIAEKHPHNYVYFALVRGTHRMDSFFSTFDSSQVRILNQFNSVEESREFSDRVELWSSKLMKQRNTTILNLARLHLLSGKEFMALEKILEGKSNREIGEDLGKSSRTIELQRASLYTKLGANSVLSLYKMLTG
jgi:DNA-binding NarL/FixJ family response regulator